jgi:shikimate kinase
MGAGKTTIGRRLARELGIAFADTDEMIVASAASTVAEIFAAEGEAGFRARELEAAREAFAGSAAVVSLGGGAVTHDATRALVATSAVRVYLRMPPQTILARLRQSPTVRPLLGALPTLPRAAGVLPRGRGHRGGGSRLDGDDRAQHRRAVADAC